MGKEWLNTAEARSLAENLRLLQSVCERWAYAWADFPSHLHAVEQYIQSLLHSPESGLHDRATRVDAAIQPLCNRAASGSLKVADLFTFPSQLESLIKEEKKFDNYRAPGLLYSQLHFHLENVVNLLVNGPADIELRASRCLEQVIHAPTSQLPYLKNLLEQIKQAGSELAPKSIGHGAIKLNELLTEVPEILFRKTEVQPPKKAWKRWLIIGVEDVLIWQDAIRKTIEFVRLQLTPHYEIDCEILSDRQSAEKRLEQLAKRSIGGASRDSGEWRPIAILDIGIPANSEDNRAPSRDEGIELLRFARSSKINIPVIVLTTAPNFLGDHIVAAELGVADYLLKGTDSEEQLVKALERIITTQPRRKLQVLDDTERLVKIDDVEVALDPQVFRTFSVFVDEAPQSVTAEHAVSLLEEKYGGYRSLAIPGQDIVKENLRLNWAEAKSHTESPEKAVEWLYSQRYSIWKSLNIELREQEVDSKNIKSVAKYLEDHYSSEASVHEDFDSKNIEKHIYQARTTIKQAFSAVQQIIFPEEEVIVNAKVGDDFAYKIIADVVLDRAEESKDQPSRFRILVAEDDIEGWQKPIAQVLRSFGYEVDVACCVQEAIEHARSLLPNLLCLDMHLPENLESFHNNLTQADPQGGLRILKAISEFQPGVRAIAFTDLAGRDEIRIRAAALGIRVTDFISKDTRPENPWDAQLILQIHRIEQEERRQALLPLPNIPRLPYIHLWQSRKDEMYVEVFGQSWPLSPNQFKLLWILAESEFQRVPTWLLLEEIYGSNDKHESLKQLVKNFRKRIAKDCQGWFGLNNIAEAKATAEAVLANDAKIGYMLNARILIDE